MRNKNIYKNILITGGAGFIGSHLTNMMATTYPDSTIVNLDALTYAADLSRLIKLKENPNYVFIEGDIRDEQLIKQIFEQYQIDGVMHLAAESHVDNSISGPKVFMETNIMGTYNLLDAARSLWQNKPGHLKDSFKHAKFLHVSTDEVYGSLGKEGYFLEETPYAPNSPYSSSKAASDMIARSYFHTYGFPVVISNCSNNYGPFQHAEKLIPTVIRKAINSENIPIYGSGTNIRDWLYVVDHAVALDLILQKGVPGQKYNIGTNNEKSNLDLAKLICAILDEMLPRDKGSYAQLITFVEDRAGHDFRYAIDSTKIASELGWAPQYSFKEALEETVRWYLQSIGG